MYGCNYRNMASWMVTCVLQAAARHDPELTEILTDVARELRPESGG